MQAKNTTCLIKEAETVCGEPVAGTITIASDNPDASYEIEVGVCKRHLAAITAADPKPYSIELRNSGGY